MIRHCVEESNVDGDMSVVDPTKIRHVTVAGGRIALLSGLIDPASHLNLPDHRATICIIAERFAVGAEVKVDSDGLVFATVPRSVYGHYGHLDYTQRLVDMIKAVDTNQEKRKQASKQERKATRSRKKASIGRENKK